jgi:hypothetical protein
MRNNTFRGRSEKMELLVSLFRDYLDAKVLDLGCAQGFLRERIQDYIGLDISGAADCKRTLKMLYHSEIRVLTALYVLERWSILTRYIKLSMKLVVYRENISLLNYPICIALILD